MRRAAGDVATTALTHLLEAVEERVERGAHENLNPVFGSTLIGFHEREGTAT